jgi:CBS domain-containing protein
VETAAISHRVADFLKAHVPFNTVAEADLLALAGGGRVRFFEPNEFILWQGEPHRLQVFVIQQGTVSLWEEQPAGAQMRDIRGAGDMLGIERFSGARSCLYTARSESDVLIYAFPADDFETCVLKYPHAAEYIAAGSRVTPDYQAAGGRRNLQDVLLRDVAPRQPFPHCAGDTSVSDAARQMLAGHGAPIVVLDAEHHARGLLTADTFLRWVAEGPADAQQPVESLRFEPAATVASNGSLADGLLKIGMADAEALVITDDGTPASRAQALITRRELAALVADDPATLLREVRTAATARDLPDLNRRARALILEHLNGPSSVEWLARFAQLVDGAILTRLVELAGEPLPACWCFCGAAGRGESLTMAAPALLAVFADNVPATAAAATFQRVRHALLESGYLPDHDQPYEAGFYAASVAEWSSRYQAWVRDPLGQETHRARSLFDVRPVCGGHVDWNGIRTSVADAVTPAFFHLLANDCLDSLPPLTFFEDQVVDTFGDHTDTFRLEYSALRPLVDVGRVFALAARDAFGRSTLERLAVAGAMLADQEAIFREASDTLKIVLWQQGRVGISEGTRGDELPAKLLSRHDRQILKAGFRSIQRLIEFTAEREWLTRL